MVLSHERLLTAILDTPKYASPKAPSRRAHVKPCLAPSILWAL
jgi:hypothetical protein